MRRRRILAAALISTALLAGCGEDEDDTNEAQPAPDTAEFEESIFDEIPRYPRSNQVQPTNDKAGVRAASFIARGATPEQILLWYKDNLGEAWRIVTPPQPAGATAWRGAWEQEELRLLISAQPATTTGDDGDFETQYNIQLGPRDILIPGGEDNIDAETE